MNILVIGCGKVGSILACTLDRMGHDVCIVDRDKQNFEHLDAEFGGYSFTGVPIDLDVLRKAGIENCEAVVAVTPEDNVNIMVSQLAREIFHVKKVLTRIYDPTRENVFSHFNLNTICPTNLMVGAVCAALEGPGETALTTFGTTTISYFHVPVSTGLVGQSPEKALVPPGCLFFGVRTPQGRLTLASNLTEPLAEGDFLVYARMID